MVKFGFFNSVDGDRKYNSDDLSHYFEGLISDGVYESVGDRLAVTAGSGMSINVGTGRAILDCRWMHNDAVEEIRLTDADIQLGRIDAVVVKLDHGTRTMSLTVVEGTPSLRPVAPTVTNTQTVRYLVLAEVTVGASTTAISQSNIKDRRGSGRCPWVTGLIKQVNTADLYDQYVTAYEAMFKAMVEWREQQQAAFNEWFSMLTDSLHVDTDVLKYQKSFTTTETASEFDVDFPEYEVGDVVLLHIGGVLFVEDSEFVISGSGANTHLSFAKPIFAGNTITIICIKGIIGGGILANEIDEINGEVV